MKKILIFMWGAVVMFSCIKDAEHHLFKEKYAAIDIEATTNVVGSIIRFSANVSNYGSEDIIDHGFIWGTRTTDYWNFTDEDLDKWIANGTDAVFRNFLLEKGTTISLGKLDKIGKFTYDENTVIGRKHFVVAYIKTDKYLIYSNVKIFDHPLSLVWTKKTLTFRIPDGWYFTANGKIYVWYNTIGELKQVGNDYSLDNRKCPYSCNTYHFVIGDIAYFSLNNNNMIKYNTVTDTWATVTENQNIPSYSYPSLSFTLGKKGYNVIYNYSLQDYYIYEFDSVTDIWTQKNKSEIKGFIYPEHKFYHRNKVYFYAGNNQLWYYDENLATFQSKSDINIANDTEYVDSIVALNDKIYMISQSEGVYNIYIYDPENDSTERLCTLHNYYPNFGSIALTLNNKIIFLPYNLNCIYELDISKF